MTGIGMAAASGATTPPPAPHTNSITLTGGATYNVTVASGDLYTLFGAVIGVSDSGGQSPYSNSPGETLAIQASSSGSNAFIVGTPTANNSVGFSGLNSVGSAVLFTVSYGSVDNLGGQANSTYPSSGSVKIQRV